VLVVTGDGELLMGLGALATIGVQAPANLAVAVLDNERYGETGGQLSHTAGGVDLPAVALACGFKNARSFPSALDMEAARMMMLREPGPVLANFKIERRELPRVMPSRDGHYVRNRFRAALLGEAAAATG
jgi:thiamine pyrophosphate-dependent acetolactate synthase large subunit-like protein